MYINHITDHIDASYKILHLLQIIRHQKVCFFCFFFESSDCWGIPSQDSAEIKMQMRFKQVTGARGQGFEVENQEKG